MIKSDPDDWIAFFMSLVIDVLSTLSVVGIWPRFIEPRLLKTTELLWELSPEQAHLQGLKILQFSDLHYHEKFPQKFLDKIAKKISQISPDLIVFTGDFLCYAQLEDTSRLEAFLSSLEAPLGSFCSLGNHDYTRYVSRNFQGYYDLVSTPNPIVGVARGVRTIFSSPQTSSEVAKRVLSVPPNKELCKLLQKTPFTLLDNETTTLPIGLNITGLGDLALGRCHPDRAFETYDPQFPGIILSHNPDSAPRLLSFPGDWILSGHTHGEQIHFPWPKWAKNISKKLARLENPELTRGLFKMDSKKLYVNRGLGCHKPFRFCSPPELCTIRCVKK